MSRVEKIENEIKELSQDELTALREWFAGFDADAWDRQMEADVNAGRLENLAERALRDHEAGRSTKL
ncbi:MAG: hypothetical protein LAO55_13260 [Acidobacteriia bacterium]|nr:hypothetical protein [Terriglobia bacterium]